MNKHCQFTPGEVVQYKSNSFLGWKPKWQITRLPKTPKQFKVFKPAIFAIKGIETPNTIEYLLQQQCKIRKATKAQVALFQKTANSKHLHTAIELRKYNSTQVLTTFIITR